MTIRVRRYVHETDYEAIWTFLVRAHGRKTGTHRNWVQPRWEYMNAHPDQQAKVRLFERFGVWEDDGTIVGFVHFEDRLGVVYVELDERYPQLKRPMLQHAIDHLQGELKAGPGVYVYLDDADQEFGAIARDLGFEPKPEFSEPTSRLMIPDPFPEVRLPEGFQLRSLADEFSVEKVHRCMHRGFNHEGEPPEDGIEGRRIKLNSPNFRRELTMVAVAPNGDFVSFCGVWPVPESQVCYIEPVATDPDYRRMGLGTAVVLEAVRRCAMEGATEAIVGSDQEFYRSMGFEAYMTQTAWWRPEHGKPMAAELQV